MATTVTSNQVTVTVVQPPASSINLTASTTSITGSGSVTFTATVTGTAGSNTVPISGATVSFYHNNGATLAGTATTNSSGVATYTYNYSDVATGTDTWYAQTGTSPNTVTSNEITINLTAAGTYYVELTIDGQASSVTLTEDVSYTATVTVTNSVYGPIQGATVTLTDTTTNTSQTATTNSQGVATFTISFTSTGTYNFVATATIS